MKTYETIDHEKRICTTTIVTDIGNFTGKSQCHPDDKMSDFFGTEISYVRAYIKLYKELKKRSQIALYENINIYNKIPKKGKAPIIVKQRIGEMKNKIDFLNREIKRNEKYIEQQIANRYDNGQK